MKLLLTSLALLVLTLGMQAQAKKNNMDKSGGGKKPVTTKGLNTKISYNAVYLTGTWKLLQAPTGDGMNMSQTWTFTKTDFTVEGYPKLNQKGKYTILKEKGDTLTLKLYNQEGDWGKADKEQKVVLNKAKNMISIGPMEFKRKEEK